MLASRKLGCPSALPHVKRSRRWRFSCQAAKISFSVPMQVPFGQSVGLVGSLEAVGKWKTANALTLTWGQDDVWSGDVEVPAGTTFEYKFFVKGPEGDVYSWQPGMNLKLDVPKEDVAMEVLDKWDGTDRLIKPEPRQPEPAKEPAKPSPLQSQTPESGASSSNAWEGSEDPDGSEGLVDSGSSSEDEGGRAPTTAAEKPRSRSATRSAHGRASSPGKGRGAQRATPSPGRPVRQVDPRQARYDRWHALMTTLSREQAYEMLDMEEPEFQGNGSTSGEDEDSYDSYGTYTEEELQSMTVKELRAVLKDLGIKQPRLKAEMIESILEAEDEDEGYGY